MNENTERPVSPPFGYPAAAADLAAPDLPSNGRSRRADRATDDLILDVHDPLVMARRFIEDHYTRREVRTIQFCGGVFYAWKSPAYCSIDNAQLRSEIYPWLAEHQTVVTKRKEQSIVNIQPNKPMVDHVVDALRAEAFTSQQPPAWLTQRAGGLPDPATLIVAPDGIYDLAKHKRRELTPGLFTVTALDYPIGEPCDDAGADPVEWLTFLQAIWPDGADAIGTLQEWAGYCLTTFTHLQKILLLVGPKRSGKGTIARVLTKLIGGANVVGPSLASLTSPFGLAPLIHARLAIIADARLSGRTDLAIVTERLLNISGEDTITIDRKHTASWTGRLPTRLMLLSNELPRLSDASGALANRFVPLVLNESFLGREDTGLESRLLAELPVIFWWAVAGYRRLMARGRFASNQAGQEAIDQLTDLASPVSAFVRDWCVLDTAHSIPRAELFEAWQAWCASEGKNYTTDAATFGRDLRAAIGGLRDSQPRIDGEKVRVLVGIDLTFAGKESTAAWRSRKGGGK